MSEENKKDENREINKIHYVLLGLLLFLIAVIRGVEYLINQGVLKLDENMSFNKFIFQLAENMTKSWIPFTIILLVLFISYVLRQIYNGKTISGKYITALLLAANLALIGKWYQSESVSRNLEQLKTKWYFFIGLLLLTVLGYFIVLFIKKKKEENKIIEKAKNDLSDPFSKDYTDKVKENKEIEIDVKLFRKQARREKAEAKKTIKAARTQARRDRAIVRNQIRLDKADAKKSIKVARIQARRDRATVKNQKRLAKVEANEKKAEERYSKTTIDQIIYDWIHKKVERILNIGSKSPEEASHKCKKTGRIDPEGKHAMWLAIVIVLVVVAVCFIIGKEKIREIVSIIWGWIESFISNGIAFADKLDGLYKVSIILLLSFGAIFALVLIAAFLFFTLYFIIRFAECIFNNTFEDSKPVRKFTRGFKAFFFGTAFDLVEILLSVPNIVNLVFRIISDIIFTLLGKTIFEQDFIDLKVNQILDKENRGGKNPPSGSNGGNLPNGSSGGNPQQINDDDEKTEINDEEDKDNGEK